MQQSKGVYTGETVINVRGTGEVFAKPDIGSFSFSVLAEGKDANEAQTKSAEATNAILAFLKESGVAEKDIKTDYYNLNPKYDFNQAPCPMYASYCPESTPKLIGYDVSQTVTVKVRDLTKSGDLISGVGGKGATNMSNLQFTIDDETALMTEARALAIADAKKQAEQLAKDLGVEIVRMTGFYEETNGGYPMPMYDSYAKGGDMMEQAVSVAPSVPTGENTIMSVVNISYEIK
jgi:uncharacterized protein YggE